LQNTHASETIDTMVGRINGYGVLGLVVGCVLLCSNYVSAETLQSNNYRFDESTLGAGGLNQSTSNSYAGSGAYGDIGVGESASNNYQIRVGTPTTPDPTLTIELLSTNANFGVLSPTSAATATASFSVINYTSYGYAVQLTGSAPTNGAHSISAMGTTAVSQPGIEQFGVNLVANTSPVSFGANPDNGQFGYGQVGTGAGDTTYSTPNQFHYASGDIIASAPKSSGKTIYTLSYLLNVAGITPGGQYASNQTIIVTGTY
jgi:hypothetical protein